MPKELKSVEQLSELFNRDGKRAKETDRDIEIESENLADEVSDLLSATSQIVSERFIAKQNKMLLDNDFTFTEDQLREMCVKDVEVQIIALKRAIASELVKTETPTTWDFTTFTTSFILKGLLDANDTLHDAYEAAIKAHDGKDQQELALLHAHRDMYRIACVSLAHADAMIANQCTYYYKCMDDAKNKLKEEMKNATVN